MVEGPIGVLALQGSFIKHAEILCSLGVQTRQVRLPADLRNCVGLVIPGGESTTMSHLIDDFALREPLIAFSRQRPVLGTCAGLILMAREVDDPRVLPLGILSCKALRNYYGRQINSFTAPVRVPFDCSSRPLDAVFIRAPGVTEFGPEVEILATHCDQAVMLGQGHHLGLAFHPELGGDPRIHAYWLKGFMSYDRVRPSGLPPNLDYVFV